jgi:PKD repeat protein
MDPSSYVFDADTVNLGYRFNVTIWVNSSEPLSLMMWQVFLTYNSSIINVTRYNSYFRGWPSDVFGGRYWDEQYVFYGQPGGVIGNPLYYNESGSPLGVPALMIGDLLMGDVLIDSPKKLCTIEFEIKMLPQAEQTLSCILGIDNSETFLYSYEGEEPGILNDGYYAIGGGLPLPQPGKYVIGTSTVVNLAPGENMTLTFTWNTSGVTPHDYVVSAKADVVPGETDTVDNTYNNGIVKVVKYPIASFEYTPSLPRPGETVTFNASASTPDGGTIISYLWDFGDGNITATDNAVIAHVYIVGDVYNVTLTAIDSDGLNSSTWALICVLTRDVSIVSITLSTNLTYVGQIISINVTAANEGELAESFNVTVYYSNTTIAVQTIHNLLPGTNTTLTFFWNTTGISTGISYAIKAEAATVPFEYDVVDNSRTDGTVRLKLIGDVNGDGIVSMLDLYILAQNFGHCQGDPSWNSNSDLNFDGIVDMIDLYLVAADFGKTD